jgi:hypothetical protein
MGDLQEEPVKVWEIHCEHDNGCASLERIEAETVEEAIAKAEALPGVRFAMEL